MFRKNKRWMFTVLIVSGLAISACDIVSIVYSIFTEGPRAEEVSSVDEPGSDPESAPVDEFPSNEGNTVADCLAPPDMYEIEFTNIRTDSFEDQWQSCHADYTLSNFSDARLIYKTNKVLEDTIDGHSEIWVTFNVNPGDTLVAGSSLMFKYTVENTPGVVTYSEVIVFIDSPECINIISDETIALWSNYTIPLDDPCN